MALDRAAKALGRTRPNPVVGAVIVKKGHVVGRGYHKAAGRAHAEVEALRRAGARARGATLYVNLEPCCHHGLTPPCVDRIIEAGIERVVIAIEDPNPEVSGRGIRRLRAAGIRVEKGLLAHEATHINEPFLTFHRLGRPFIVAKWAMTLDGRYRSLSRDSRWITNDESRRYVHELRARYDAIMVGIGTVLSDNPRLNVRLPGRPDVIQPVRVIVDGRLRTPVQANCLDHTDAGPTILVTTDSASERRINRLRDAGATVFVVRGSKAFVDLGELVRYLHAMSIQSVFVEGGEQLLSAMFRADLVDRVVGFIAPKLVGGEAVRHVLSGWGVREMSEAIPFQDVVIRHFGNDVCVEGYVHHGIGAPTKPASRRRRSRK